MSAPHASDDRAPDEGAGCDRQVLMNPDRPSPATPRDVPHAASLPLSGWGRFEGQRSAVYRPESWPALEAIVRSAPERTVIARGLGRSYGDSAVNGGAATVLTQRLDRILELDLERGTIVCEGGAPLSRLLSFLVPKGLFLPVVPGTRFVTVGGALAADIHGKNHHVDGTIGRHVEELTLLSPSGEVLRCSAEEHREAFDATLGGMGLTGFILSARLRLLPIETPLVRVVTRRARRLDELLSMLRDDERSSRYSVAWIDALGRGRSLGRGVLIRGDHLPAAELPPGAPPRARLPETVGVRVPFDAPSFVLGPASVSAFNALYFSTHRGGTQLSDLQSFFFPLDRIGAWNLLYGKRGFVQYQAQFPSETAEEGCARMLEEVSRARVASFLAVLKTTGPEGRGLLSFPRPGITFALDIPNLGEPLRPLARCLDEIVLRAGGRLYLAKDALADAGMVAQMYPRLPAFRAARSRLDPLGRIDSTQARRLALRERA